MDDRCFNEFAKRFTSISTGLILLDGLGLLSVLTTSTEDLFFFGTGGGGVDAALDTTMGSSSSSASSSSSVSKGLDGSPVFFFVFSASFSFFSSSSRCFLYANKNSLSNYFSTPLELMLR